MDLKTKDTVGSLLKFVSFFLLITWYIASVIVMVNNEEGRNVEPLHKVLRNFGVQMSHSGGKCGAKKQL